MLVRSPRGRYKHYKQKHGMTEVRAQERHGKHDKGGKHDKHDKHDKRGKHGKGRR